MGYINLYSYHVYNVINYINIVGYMDNDDGYE